jgi:glycosyltransferase involved in cell wall biosynthesis
MKRRLIISAPRGSGGGLTHLREVIPRLARIMSRWELVLHAPRETLASIPDRGEGVIRCELAGSDYASRVSWEFLTLPRLAADPSSLVYAPFGPPLNFGVGPHCVFMARNIIPLLPPETWEVSPNDVGRNHVLRMVFGTQARCARRVICVSHHAAARLRLLSGRDDGIDVVPHGCAMIEQPAPKDDRVRTLLGRPFLLSVGQPMPYRRVDELIGAMKLLADREVPPLVLVGGDRDVDRDYGEACARFAEPLEREGRIIRLGQLGAQDVQALTAAATLIVYPSVHEDCPNVILEGMAAGKAILCADIPATRELADGVAQFVADPRAASLAQGISALLGDEPRRHSLERRALERSARYDWQKTAERTAESLERAFLDHGRDRRVARPIAIGAPRGSEPPQRAPRGGVRLLIDAVPAHSPGMQNVVRDLVRAVIDRCPAGSSIVLLQPEGRPPPFSSPNLEVVSVTPPSRSWPALWTWFYRTLPDLVERHGADATYSASGILSQALGERCGTIGTVNNMLPFHPQLYSHWSGIHPREISRLALLRHLYIGSLRGADSVILHSQYALDVLSRGVPDLADKTRVIHTGVPRSTALDPANPPRHPYGGRPYVLYLTTIHWYKNHLTLVEAYRRALATGAVLPDLVLAGLPQDPPYLAEVLAAIDAAALSHRIRYVGVVPREDISAWMHHATLNVFPSICETNSVVLAEIFGVHGAMASSNYPPMPEIGGNAMAYFDPLDPDEMGATIVTLCNDPSARRRLRQDAALRASELSWEACGDALWACARDATNRFAARGLRAA